DADSEGNKVTLFDTTFHRVDVRYDHRFGGPEDRLRQAVTLGYDLTTFPQQPRQGRRAGRPAPSPPQPEPDAYVDDLSLHARTELTKRVGAAVLLRAGIDAGVDGYQARNLQSAFNGCTSDADCGGARCDQSTRTCQSSPGDFPSLFSDHTDFVVGAHVDAV